MRSHLFLFTVLLLSWPIAASAGIVYNDGSPITDSCSPVCPELTSSIGHGVFTLVADATLTSATFWTFQSPGVYNGGTFIWQIFQDNGGAHGALIGSSTFTLSQTFMASFSLAGVPLDEYQNDFTIANLLIHPSSSPQSYFLDIADTSGRDTFGIFWATSGPDTLAFELSGTGNTALATPEPATLALLAAGLFACRWRRSLRT